jgi:hypothetical protein
VAVQPDLYGEKRYSIMGIRRGRGAWELAILPYASLKRKRRLGVLPLRKQPIGIVSFRLKVKFRTGDGAPAEVVATQTLPREKVAAYCGDSIGLAVRSGDWTEE